MPHLIDFDTELPKILIALDTQRTDDNAESFQQVVDGASEFIHLAIQQKNPSVSTLIREVFKRKMITKEDTSNKVCDVLAEQLKSQLFVASDNKQSKISNVVADICS